MLYVVMLTSLRRLLFELQREHGMPDVDDMFIDDARSVGGESMVTDSDWLSDAGGFADDEASDRAYESMSEYE